MRVSVLTVLTVAVLIFGVGLQGARANGYDIDLAEVGRIDAGSAVPNFRLVRRPREEHARRLQQRGRQDRVEDVVLQFERGGEIVLGELRIHPEPESPAIPREHGVVESSVVAGWLDGADDLLLVAWTDDGSSYGTTGSVFRGTMVVRATLQGAVSLLRSEDRYSGRTRHLGYPGLVTRHYEFDAARRLLTERISTVTWLESGTHQPLYHPTTDEGGERIYAARIAQVIHHRYRYRNGSLRSQSIELQYKAQKGDGLRSIAQFYLGALAPVEALLAANPELRKNPDNLEGRLITIPVPRDWLLRTYGPERLPQHGESIDPALLEKVRPLYPEVGPRRGDRGESFFSSVEQEASVRLADGTERLVVRVGVTVPAARVDHGWSALLFFKDAADARPMLTLSLMPPPTRLIDDRWLELDSGGPLVSLLHEESLQYLKDYGAGLLIQGLTVSAARDALQVYLDQGREAFLARAPVRRHQEARVRLPERISRFEIYPSLVEDMRPSRFRYSDAWEATVLVRLIPADEPRKAIILEIGAGAVSAGIEAHEVELILWETRCEEPTDRPAP